MGGESTTIFDEISPSRILESLDEGILCFGSDGVIRPGATKLACELFGGPLEGKSFAACVPAEESERQKISAWIELVFEGMLSFEDFAPMAPTGFEHDGKKIGLEFRPAYASGPEKRISHLICLARNRTDEVALAEKAERNASHVELILSVLRDRAAFSDFVQECRKHIAHFRGELGKESPNVDALFREMHTLKGSVASYNLQSVAELAHEVEGRVGEIRLHGETALKRLRKTLEADADALEWRFESMLREEEVIITALGEGSLRMRTLPLERMLVYARSLAALEGQDSPLVERFIREFILDDASALFQRYETTVKTIARRQKKQVVFRIEKDRAQVFTEPYLGLIAASVHIFRNAVDHGLEAPADRVVSGKEEAGKITVGFAPIRVKGKPPRLRITFADDGRGVDIESIRKKSVERGLFSREEAEAMDEPQLFSLLFLSGFTTKSEVSEYSGRGVGLDAVKFEVDELGGTIIFWSIQGGGTQITVEVPLFENPRDVLDFTPSERLAA